MNDELDDIDAELEEAGRIAAEEHAKQLVEKGYRKGYLHSAKAWRKAVRHLITDRAPLDSYVADVQRWANDPVISNYYPAPLLPDLE